MDKSEKKLEHVEHQECTKISEQRKQQESDDGANRLWKQVHERGLLANAHPEKAERHHSRVRELAEKKGRFSEAEKRDLAKAVDKEVYGNDDAKRQTDERTQQEAQQMDKKRIGQIWHEAARENRRATEHAKGKKEGREYQTEAVLDHPEGKKPRPDAVEYQERRITDDKPIGSDYKAAKHLLSKYRSQRNDHLKGFEHTTGQKAQE